jgi:hypothetical protein
MVKHRTFTEWKVQYDTLIKELGYTGAIPRILGRKKILFEHLKLEKLILEFGFTGLIPADYKKRSDLFWNLRQKSFVVESEISNEFEDELYELYTPEGIRITSKELANTVLANYKNQKKSIPHFDKKYLKTILQNHKYVIDFETQTDIFAHHKTMKKHIFLNLTSGPIHGMEISIHQLIRFLTDLKINRNEKKFKPREIIERVGALTDYDWHAFNPFYSRKIALKRKCAKEGIMATLNTLLHLSSYSRWGSPNSLQHEYLDISLHDIDWLKKEFPVFDNASKKFLRSRIKISKNKFLESENYENIDLMLIVNTNF